MKHYVFYRSLPLSVIPVPLKRDELRREFLLEFIPAKAGAGMTMKQNY